MLQHSTTVRAATVDEAIAQGLQELNLPREEAEINVISEGKRGFLGFGAQDAIVEVRRLQDISYADLTDSLERMKETEPASSQTSTLQSDKLPEEYDTSKIDEDTTELETMDYEENMASVDPESKDVYNVQKVDQREEAVREVFEEAKEEKVPEEPKEEAVTDTRSDNIDEVAVEVIKYLEDIITEYGAESQISYEVDGRQIFFDIETDKSGLVIGKHGKIINALQILAQTLLLSRYQHHLNVTLNVGDYRRRRANVLEQMAMSTADEVLSTRQPVALDSLPAYERKQIHAHLSKMKNIRTHSEGREPNRYLIVEYVEDK